MYFPSLVLDHVARGHKSRVLLTLPVSEHLSLNHLFVVVISDDPVNSSVTVSSAGVGKGKEWGVIIEEIIFGNT